MWSRYFSTPRHGSNTISSPLAINLKALAAANYVATSGAREMINTLG